MILYVICVLISIFFAMYHWNRRKLYRISWQLNGPMAWPIIGNAFMLRDQKTAMQIISDLIKRYKNPFRFWLGTRLLVVYSNPEDFETIITSQQTMDKGDVYKFLKFVIGGDGLLSSSGERWQYHRKQLSPAVQHYTIINSVYPILNRHVRVFMEKMNEWCDVNPDKQFDIFEPITACALDMICETTFGTQLDAQQGKNLTYLDAVNNMLLVAGVRILQPWYQNDFIFRLSKYYKDAIKSVNISRTFASKVYNDKKAKYSQNMSNGKHPTDMVKKHSFIDILLKLSVDENIFSMDDVITESATLVVAGFETTATTLSNIILMLAIHPKYQEEVYNELRSIFPSSTSDVTVEHLGQLNIVDRVCKETLRLLPTVPLLARFAKADIKIGGIIVPAGTELILAVDELHNDPEVWGPNATQFDPDHFLPNNLKSKHPYAYIPFSAGPRNCIGLKYANIVLRLFVCGVLRNFKFSTHLKLKDLQFRMNLARNLLNKHMVYVERRESY